MQQFIKYQCDPVDGLNAQTVLYMPGTKTGIKQKISQWKHRTNSKSAGNIPRYDYSPRTGLSLVEEAAVRLSASVRVAMGVAAVVSLSLSWPQTPDSIFSSQTADMLEPKSTVIAGISNDNTDYLQKITTPDEHLPVHIFNDQQVQAGIKLQTRESLARLADRAQEPGSRLTLEDGLTWLTLTVQSGDNLSHLFNANNLNRYDLHKILDLGKSVKKLKYLRPGQQIRVKHDTDGRIKTLMLELNHKEDLFIEQVGESYESRINERQLEVKTRAAAATIDMSLFAAAKKSDLPAELVSKMVKIFGWDVDFAMDIQAGDSFRVVYEESYYQGEKVAVGEILAAEFINKGHIYRAVKYTDPTGASAYFTPEGSSMQKAFLKTPVKIGRISSHFNLRRKHPVLNKIRAHKGVDYAAPRGTEIYASGEGTIKSIGWRSGYGKTVELQHGEKYTTLYAHMSKFPKDLKKGSKVKQGQVIGYVGSTGLATGPHLHYEFRIDGVHKNPLKVDVAKAVNLDEKYRKDFEQHSQALMAQLDKLGKQTVVMQTK